MLGNLLIMCRWVNQFLQRNKTLISWCLLITASIVFFVSIRPEYVINSDSSYLQSIYKDIFVDNIDIKTWHTPPSTYFFPDLLMLIITVTLGGGNLALGSWLLVIFQFAAIVVLSHFLINTIFKSQGGFKYILLNFLFILILTLSREVKWVDDIFKYMFYPAFHTGALISAMLCAIIVLSIKKSRRNVIIYFVLWLIILLTSLSDRIFLTYFSVPFLLTIIYKERNKFWKSNMFYLVLSAAIIGAGCSFYLDMIGFSGRYDMGFLPIEAIKSIKYYLFSIFREFGFAMLNLIIIFAVTIVWKSKQFKNYNKTFLILQIIFPVIFSILTGTYVYIFEIRYFVFTAFVSLIVIVGNINIVKEQGVIALIFIISVLLITNTINDISSITNPSDFRPGLTKCVDENKERYGLANGFGEYWYSKNLSILSHTNTRIIAINQSLDVETGIMNTSWLNNQKINFIILTDLNKEVVLSKYGEKKISFMCDDNEIWVYSDYIE